MLVECSICHQQCNKRPTTLERNKSVYCSRACYATSMRGKPRYAPTEERFWSQVDKSGDCWLWLGYKTDKGYGLFHLPLDGRRKVHAHRFAYELVYGAIPDGYLACHKCDNPSCVRPDHIFPGAPAENTADMTAKGRAAFQARREQWLTSIKQNMSTKLTPDQVQTIRDLYTQEQNCAAIARRFGVDRKTISRIIRGESWSNI